MVNTDSAENTSLDHAVSIEKVMSPIEGQEEFRGATTDYAGYACREEAHVAAHERGTTEECFDIRGRGGPSLVETLPGSDIALELAKISSRLDSMERDRQSSGQ